MCIVYVLWCLLCTWCCQCLLHLSYVLAICMCCGALGICVVYVCVLGCLECTYMFTIRMWCLERTYVLAIFGAWSAPMSWLYVVLGAHLCVGYMYCGVLGMHLVQEGSGPCKIPNFSHLLELWGIYVFGETCTHRPATKLICHINSRNHIFIFQLFACFILGHPEKKVYF